MNGSNNKDIPGGSKKTLPPLSPRLKLIANMVSSGSRLADIGCDHGYLAIYLAKTNICQSCIAADINKMPLAAAAENIRLYGCEDKVSTRLSDGLKAFRPDEADTVVISGMGGRLICRILTDGAHALPGIKELILEPQSDAAAVRKYLCENNYNITDEAFTSESGKYYPIIKAVPGKSPVRLSEAEYEFGPVLLKRKDPLLYEYLLNQKEVLSSVYASLPHDAASAYSLQQKLDVIEAGLGGYTFAATIS